MMFIVVGFLIFSLTIAMAIYADFYQSKIDKSINAEWVDYLEEPINNENERLDYNRFYKNRRNELKVISKKKKSLYDVILVIYIIILAILFFTAGVL